jgi:hypothetical protein
MSDGSEDENIEPQSLIVTLRYRKRETLQKQAAATAAPDAAQSLPSPVNEAPSLKEDVPVQHIATLPPVANSIPAQSKTLQVPATGQPTPGLKEIQQEPSLPMAAPPGMLAMNPASASPPNVLSSQVSHYHAQASFDVNKTAPSPAPVSSN